MKFDVYLPVIKDEKSEITTKGILNIGNLENILLVDDEPKVTKTMKKMLNIFTYNAILMNNTEEVFKVFPENFAGINRNFTKPGLVKDI